MKTTAFALLSLTLAAAVACGSDNVEVPTSDAGQGSNTPTPTLEVVTTIYPLTYFAQQVGGERIQVTAIVRPGIDAHDFEPTPGDILTISNADVLVYNHPSFEGWIEDAIESADNTGLLAVQTAGLPDDAELSGDHGEQDESEHEGEDGHDQEGEDPHVWLNPIEATEQVRAIQQAFTSADAEGAETYRANADDLVARLLELDTEIGESLNSCTLDHVVVSHEAYGHLAERYGLEQIGLADLSAEFDSTPRRVADIIDEMRSLGVSHILQEPILSDDLAETVAAETGAEILPLHPLESLTPAEQDAGEDYFSVMRRNLQSLQTALGCD